ncbi:unnamed protein product [Prunus armeniaca]
MRIVKRGTPLPALGEPILSVKLQKIPRKRSPPTRLLGSADERTDLRGPTRRSISVARIAKVANVIDQQCARKTLRRLWTLRSL